MTPREKLLKNIIKIGIFATLFLPFVVTDSLFFPFITGKNFAFRIIIEILLILWVWLALGNKKYAPKRSAMLWAVLAFFGAVAIATIFSISPFKSLWSNAERMEGLFGLLHVFSFFIITASVFNKKDWMQFFFVSLIASVGVAFHGFFQKLGVFETNRGARVDANFGNSTYLSMYNVFHFFFALYLITRIRAKQYVPFGMDWGKFLQWAFAALAVLHVIVLWFTNTRGAILGLLGGLFLAALLTAIFSKGGRAKRWSRIGLVIIVLIPTLFFVFRNTTFVQETPVIKRFANISLTEQTTESRLTIWGMALEAAGDRPITGWGPGNFTTVYAEYYVPKLWKQEPWFDRAHNVSINWLTSTGILGFVTYHALFVIALVYIWKLYKRNTFSATQGALFVGLLGAYFIHNFFVFDNVVSYILFFGVLGWLHHIYAGSREEEAPLIDGHMARNFVAVLLTLLLIFSIYVYNIKPIQASGAVLDGLRALASRQLGTQNIEDAQASFERVFALNTFITTEAREQMLNRGINVENASLAGREARSKFKDTATEQGEMHIERFPYDIRMRSFLATLYIESGNFTEARETAEALVELAPTRPLFYLILGQALLEQGEFEASLETFETAFELSPDNPQAQEGLAIVLIQSRLLERARPFLQEHYGTVHPPLLRIVQSYLRINALGDAILTAENLVEVDPNNVRWRFTLAQLYIQAFRDTEAIRELQTIIDIDARLGSQMQALIKQIEDGTVTRNQ